MFMYHPSIGYTVANPVQVTAAAFTVWAGLGWLETAGPGVDPGPDPGQPITYGAADDRYPSQVEFDALEVEVDAIGGGGGGGGGSPTGAAGGSLAGTYPNPTLAANSVGASQVTDGSITNAELNASAGIAWSKLAVPAAATPWNGQRITGLGTPAASTDAATQGYVDSLAQGLDPKPSVKAASTANLTLSGAQTVDGVALVATDRVLVKNQTAPADNGLYVVAAGAWSRASDLDAWAEVAGAFTFIEAGTTQASSGWVAAGASGGTLGTTAITWSQFSGAGTILAGTGLSKTGNTLSITAGGVTGTEIAAAIKDAAAATASLRTLGTGATQAAPGDDTRITGALPKAGGTMTGALTLAGAPSSSLHAATKAYVDTGGSPPVFDVVATYGGVGDDSANNKTAIDNAIAAAVAAGGGVVFFRPGSFKTTGGHALPANVHIRGSDPSPRYYGLASTVPTASCRLVQTSGTNTAMFTADAAMRGASISDITLAGNNVSTSGAAAIHGLDFTSAPSEQSFTLQNTSIVGFSGDGWRGRLSVVRAHNFLVGGCKGYGAQTGASYWTDSTFTDGYFVGNRSGNVLVDGTTQSGLVKFSGVRFERAGWDPALNGLASGGTAGAFGVKLVNAKDFVFTACSTDANSGHGVWLYRANGTAKNVYNITFQGCIFNRDGWGAGGDTAASGQDYASVRVEGGSTASVDYVTFIGCETGYGKPRDDGVGTQVYPYHAVTWIYAFYPQWIGGRVAAAVTGNAFDNSASRWVTNWRPVKLLADQTVTLPAFSSGAQPSPATAGDLWWNSSTSQAMVSNGTTATALAAGSSGGSELNVLNYLAGTGGLESGAAIANLLSAWASTKKTLYWPGEGSYLIPSNTFSVPAYGLSMRGDGLDTVITKSGNGYLIDVSGADAATRRDGVTIRDLTLYAGTTTGSLLRAYYTTMLYLNRILFSGDPAGNGCGIDAVQWWDSLVEKVDMENVGSTTEPGIKIRSSAAASGFGYSTDNSNALRFVACRVEGFRAGAISVTEGHATGTNSHDISFTGLKCETGTARGAYLVVDSACNNINVAQAYLFCGGFDSGYTTKFPVVDFAPYNGSTLRDVFIGASGDYLSAGVLLAGDGTRLDRVSGEFTIAPSSTYFVAAGSATNVSADSISTTHGTRVQTPSSWAPTYP